MKSGFVGVLFCFVSASVALGPMSAPKMSGAEIYVWQRRWSPDVSQALLDTERATTGFAVLTAEVAWTNGQPRIWRAEPDWKALKATGRPIGLVLRVGGWAGPFGADSDQVKTLGGARAGTIDASAQKRR